MSEQQVRLLDGSPREELHGDQSLLATQLDVHELGDRKWHLDVAMDLPHLLPLSLYEEGSPLLDFRSTEVDDRLAVWVDIVDLQAVKLTVEVDDGLLGLADEPDRTPRQLRGDQVELVDVAGHDDSSEVDVRVVPYTSSKYLTIVHGTGILVGQIRYIVPNRPVRTSTPWLLPSEI